MLNPCVKCQEEGIKNINGLVLKRIAHRYYKVKTIYGEFVLCDIHFDNVNPLDKDILEIKACGISFVNSVGRAKRE